MKDYTCGACGATFGSNCADDDITCAVCDAKRCPHCDHWFGGDLIRLCGICGQLWHSRCPDDKPQED